MAAVRGAAILQRVSAEFPLTFCYASVPRGPLDCG